MSYTLELAWREDTSSPRCQDAIAFWQQEGAIKDPVQARLRAERLLVIARDGDGQIAAVSTAFKEVVHNFGFSMYLFQIYIGRRHRRPGLATAILQRAGEELEARFQQGENRDTLGLVMEMTNPKLMRVLDQTVWRVGDMEIFYSGRSQRGNDLRVWYFGSTRIPR